MREVKKEEVRPYLLLQNFLKLDNHRCQRRSPKRLGLQRLVLVRP